MEDKKEKILSVIGVIILLLLLGGIIYFLYFHDIPGERQKEEPRDQGTTSLPSGEERDSTGSSDSGGDSGASEDIEYSPDSNKFSDKEDWGESDVRKFASSFAERFGSYSSHSGFGNINDLRIFMNEDMRDWADGYIEDRVEDKTEDNDYYGISTVAVATQMEEFNENEGEALARVETQRTETRDDEERVFTQTIEITLSRESGDWKVSRAEWKQ